MELKQKPAVDQSLLSTISSVKDLVEYQNGAVVSRTIIKKPTGTVTFFAFDEGEALSEHTAPFDAIANILDGEAEISIADKGFLLTEGEMIILPANIPHALKAIKRFKMMLTMLKD